MGRVGGSWGSGKDNLEVPVGSGRGSLQGGVVLL